MRELALIVDFGSQYSQLIARRVRELGVYCEIVRHDLSAAAVADLAPQALIFSGGPASVLGPQHPEIDQKILQLGIPILGICYGMQLLALRLGGAVAKGAGGEYGPARIAVREHEGLFADLPDELDVWMSHGDHVNRPPEGFEILAHSAVCGVAAMGDAVRRIYGVQFHPEVVHTPLGKEILRNFLFRVAGCQGGWSMSEFVEASVREIRARVGSAKVICALSGGVDSAVVAALIHRAIGDQMSAIFVDNGVLRQGEALEIRRMFTEDYPLNFRMVDACEAFLEVLKGVEDPERKRKAIGGTFIRVFQDEAAKIADARFLAQGTLYPDVIESHSAHGGPSAVIKSHHNVGGLPENVGFDLIEPLKYLFKDEVRVLGRELGLPARLLDRQPFPGPGLAVRIIGEVNRENLAVLRAADVILQQELERWDRYPEIWQAFAVLLPVKSVGVMGDERTYAEVVAIRAVTSLDGMTADWVKLPYDILARISARIINEVDGVNRVVYDISSKPPSTIEWE